MDDKELTEVPLSNREVLKVLKARYIKPSDNDQDQAIDQPHHPRTIEMIEYLESIEKGPYRYPLEILRNLKINKNLDADLTTLAIVSNMSDISILNLSDQKRVTAYFDKNGKNI